MANPENLVPNEARTPERRKEIARKAGKASGIARRERKTIAESLRRVLDEPANADGVTRREAIIAKVVKRLYDDGDIRDLETLAKLLGEYEQKVNLSTPDAGLVIGFKKASDD